MHRLALGPVVTPFLLGIIVAACGGKVVDQPATASDGETFLERYCETFGTCCPRAGLPPDRDKCLSNAKSFWGAASYDATRGSRCLEDLRAYASSGALCSDGHDFVPPSCSNVFVASGTRALGETCDTLADCAPSTEGPVECGSVPASHPLVYVCRVSKRGEVGDSPCVATRDGNVTLLSASPTVGRAPRVVECDQRAGARCDDASDVCVAIPKVGEACSKSFGACSDNAWCDGSACVPQRSLGSSCVATGSAECGSGAFCDGGTHACTKKRAAGSACFEGAECTSGFCIDRTCRAPQVAFVCGK